jgi:hypothetical protein
MTKQMQEWRKRHPRARRTNPVAIEHSGGTVRRYGCLCGDTITMCAKWPMTKRVSEWIAQHNATCQPTPTAGA